MSILLATSLFSLTAACSSNMGAETKPVIPTPTEWGQTPPAAAPTQICDCFFDREVRIWNDADQDGTFDENESPIEGVEFRLIVDDTNRDTATSDAQGYAMLSYATNKCECFNWSFEVVFELPAGYELIAKKWVEAETYTGMLYEVALAKVPSVP